MKLNKPKFWDSRNSFFSFLLLPISLVILLFVSIKKKITRSIKFNIPIICVGNIYIGGTGKTPSSIFLAKELYSLGKNPVIIRKYYKSHIDEHNLIKSKFKNLILCQNRTNGIRKAKKNNYDTVILDDGFQDYKIKKKLNIICFNQNQLIGNGLIIPSGPLRESLNALKDANIIIINGGKTVQFERKILNINKDLEIFYSHYKPTNINQFKNKKLLAIAGIGNPENFFKLLEENKLYVKKKLIFPDHYEFTKIEIKNIIKEAQNKNFQII
ncbi:tetraacyldisaccharide 4'-kinase, partial [Pelagibacteraceae bacterium]|nr:tetraacyldisaccharide 4'-kinase [Pelagibacteraceae bacterium]